MNNTNGSPPCCPARQRTRLERRRDNRLFVETVLWMARSGSPWRDLPPDFGPWSSVYQRFAIWSRAQLWYMVFAELGGRRRLRGSLHRQHRCACPPPCHRCVPITGGQAIGRSRGGLTTRIHALVDGLGMLARFRPTGGQAGDSPEALPLLDELKPASLAVDKVYDSNAILQHLQSAGVQAVIPSRANRLEQRPLDEHLYASRNLVERFRHGSGLAPSRSSQAATGSAAPVAQAWWKACVLEASGRVINRDQVAMRSPWQPSSPPMNIPS